MSMESQITHRSVLAILIDHALPIDGLGEVHVARMMKSGPHFHETTKRALFDPFDYAFRTRVVRELGAASNDQFRVPGRRGDNREIRRLIDSKRFYRSKMFACCD